WCTGARKRSSYSRNISRTNADRLRLQTCPGYDDSMTDIPLTTPNPGRTLPLQDYEAALARNKGRLNDAARELGVSRVTLGKKIKRHKSLRAIQEKYAR